MGSGELIPPLLRTVFVEAGGWGLGAGGWGLGDMRLRLFGLYANHRTMRPALACARMARHGIGLFGLWAIDSPMCLMSLCHAPWQRGRNGRT